MKKKLFGISGIVIILIAIIGVPTISAIQQKRKEDVVVAFAADIQTFVTKHNGKLPSNWDEFCRWNTSEGNKNWSQDLLENYFLILNPPKDADSRTPTYIYIKDRRIKSMEWDLNELIYTAKTKAEGS